MGARRMRSLVAIGTYLRSEASERGGDASAILELQRGQVVEVVGHDRSGRWSRVFYHRTELGTEGDLLGYVRTRDLETDTTATAAVRSGIDLRSSAGSLAHRLTQAYDGVRYRLGAKARPDPVGHIDCSGWTAWVAFRIMDFANAESRRRIFSSSDKNMVNTYSDAQIKSVKDATGYVARNEALRSLSLPLYLIGVNFGNHDWESNADRAYGIDHVVITVASAGGGLLVSQSSSSGGGVNLVPYADWYRRVSSKPMHGVDLMLLGSWLTGTGARTRDRDGLGEGHVLPDPDTRAAGAG